jgi:hypothetical protein
VVAANGHVLGHVAAGLAEEPDGGAVYRLAEAGTDETAGAGCGLAQKEMLPLKRRAFGGVVLAVRANAKALTQRARSWLSFAK